MFEFPNISYDKRYGNRVVVVSITFAKPISDKVILCDNELIKT
jgi:hypothetical protein